jgi:hypothetical protein
MKFLPMNTTGNVTGYLKENLFQSTDMINTTQYVIC